METPSAQLLDLSSRLEGLQEDHRGSQGLTQRLKKENETLKQKYVCKYSKSLSSRSKRPPHCLTLICCTLYIHIV